MSQTRILWSNARIATCDERMSEIADGAVLTVGNRIEWLGAEASLPGSLTSEPYERRDLSGKWITPGLVDCHTHLVFGGNRAHEWNRLLNGVTYEEIARSGGGILSTVTATRAASPAQLFDQTAARLECLLAEGVTVVEIKSGYGLTLADERKMLRVARSLELSYPVTVRTTFLAAHAIPPEFKDRADDYIDEIVCSWLPTLHGEGLIDTVDVFCERIAFDVVQSERLLVAAANLGIPVRMHAEQLSNMGASQLAVRHRALSCDHLEYSSDADVQEMARQGTVAVLLPSAFLHLRETRLPPIASMRTHGTRIAIASDCNPGSSPAPSLLLAGALATRLFRLTPGEVLAGVTRNAARACGAERQGVLEVGANADFAVWDVGAPDEIFYWMGRNSCAAVIRNAQVVRCRI